MSGIPVSCFLRSLRFQSVLLIMMAGLCLAPGDLHAQNKTSVDPNAPNAPPDVTILAHELRYENRLITRRAMVVNRLVRMATIKVQNNSNRKIAGISWYFVVLKNREEVYFRLPYATISEIDPNKSKTLKGFFWVPRTEQTQTVTVEDLELPPKFQSVVLVSCVLFSDGSFSALNDSAKQDCDRLQRAKRR